ncbi:hypothetical protein HA402_007256 [Bradysia odoriphaga]|nr:hypothetical protein HA402_007256 [Bradysia odoriphaga]
MNSKNIFFLLLLVASVSAKRDSIRLKDVNTLTLYSDKWTTSRRSAPVKQLTCVGGHCNRAQIETAQCYNRGFDGNDVQWECKAELPSNYKFGRLEVSCEGYDYPEDDYILVGSCGLEYTIAEVSKTSNSYFPSSFPSSDHRTKGDSGSTIITILFIGGAIALYFYLRPSQTREQRNNTSGGSSFNPSAPPPPGFRPDFCGSSDTSFGTSSTGNSNNPGASNGPGFFSGMATGGILGYLFGSNRNNGYGRRDYQQSSFWNNPSGYSSFGSLRPGSSGGSTTKSTSTGFASTKRR